MPTDGNDVLVYIPHFLENACNVVSLDEDGCWYDYKGHVMNENMYEVKYWMPLPKPPKN